MRELRDPRVFRALGLGAGLLLLSGWAERTGAADGPISFNPVWRAVSQHRPTGVGWADMDGDGRLDLAIVSHHASDLGAHQVFFQTDAGLEETPRWVAVDAQPSGALVLADFDHDGTPDLAVAAQDRHGANGAAGSHVLYLNAAGLPEQPSWQSPPAYAAACAAGDPDGDGDLDLAFAQGCVAADSMPSHCLPVVVFRNDFGRLSAEPAWSSAETYVGTDIAWADIDGDGGQDLVLAAASGGVGVACFFNQGGTLETSPSWVHGAMVGVRQIAFGDVDGDGDPDLAACEFEDRAGGGAFVLLLNDGGVLARAPVWSCASCPEPSAVAWGDADGDGDLDLAAGCRNGTVGIFENSGGRLSAEFVWSHTPGAVQQIAWGDRDNSGLAARTFTFEGDGHRRLFDLGLKALHAFETIRLDGAPLPADAWCCDAGEGWLSLARPPAPGSVLQVDVVASTDLDLAVAAMLKTVVYDNEPQEIPRDVKALLLLGDTVGANVDFDYVHPEVGRVNNSILTHLERYGWEVTLAGAVGRVDSCGEPCAQVGQRSVQVDSLVTDIVAVDAYDVIMVLPGRSHNALISSPSAMEILRSGVRRGLVVAAWCRGVQVLAAARVIEGRRVAGKADYRRDYEEAGATYVGEEGPPVIDGPIVTTANSFLNRTEMCEAIARAVVELRGARR